MVVNVVQLCWSTSKSKCHYPSAWTILDFMFSSEHTFDILSFVCSNQCHSISIICSSDKSLIIKVNQSENHLNQRWWLLFWLKFCVLISLARVIQRKRLRDVLRAEPSLLWPFLHSRSLWSFLVLWWYYHVCDFIYDSFGPHHTKMS